jgi:hypothetical protein
MRLLEEHGCVYASVRSFWIEDMLRLFGFVVSHLCDVQGDNTFEFELGDSSCGIR